MQLFTMNTIDFRVENMKQFKKDFAFKDSRTGILVYMPVQGENFVTSNEDLAINYLELLNKNKPMWKTNFYNGESCTMYYYLDLGLVPVSFLPRVRKPDELQSNIAEYATKVLNLNLYELPPIDPFTKGIMLRENYTDLWAPREQVAIALGKRPEKVSGIDVLVNYKAYVATQQGGYDNGI